MTKTHTRRVLTAAGAAVLAIPLGIAGTGVARAEALSSQTAQTLQFMIAEEKLAHDMYTTLGNQYGTRTFSRIAAAEARHESSVRTLLARYGISDPTVGDAVGEFDDPTLQRLYDSLVADGRESLADAAKAGRTVERRDIADLDRALAANPPGDIAQVLERLRSGSTRHLTAFTRLAGSTSLG